MTLPDDVRQIRETSFGYQIQRLASVIEREMSAALLDHNLSLAQFAVMMTVLEHGAMTQADIGARFSMPAYAISRAIDALETEKLLHRAPHPTSRRSHLIEPTEAGLAKGPALFAIVRKVNAALVAPLSAEEQAQLAALLPKLRTAFDP